MRNSNKILFTKLFLDLKIVHIIVHKGYVISIYSIKCDSKNVRA